MTTPPNHTPPNTQENSVDVIKGPALTPKQLNKAWAEDERKIKEAMNQTAKDAADAAWRNGTVLREVYQRMIWPHVKRPDGTLRFRTFKDVIEAYTPYRRSQGWALLGAVTKLTQAQFRQLGQSKAVVIGESAIRPDHENFPRLLQQVADPKITEREARNAVRVAQGQPPVPPRRTGPRSPGGATYSPLGKDPVAVSIMVGDDGIGRGETNVAPGVFVTIQARKPEGGALIVQVGYRVEGTVGVTADQIAGAERIEETEDGEE